MLARGRTALRDILSTMPLALAPGISFCELDGARIFLDRERDRYFSLGPEAAVAFATIGQRAPGSAEDAAVLDRLVASGILVRDPHGEAPRPCRTIAVKSSPLDDDPHLPAATTAVLVAAQSISRAQIALKLFGFARACRSVADMAPGSRHAQAISPRVQAELAGRFAGAARLVGAFEKCLPTSLAMIRFCRGRDYDAQLVIGVKTRPFQAHAWVSTNGVVLTDTTETARQFTPILIL